MTIREVKLLSCPCKAWPSKLVEVDETGIENGMGRYVPPAPQLDFNPPCVSPAPSGEQVRRNTRGLRRRQPGRIGVRSGQRTFQRNCPLLEDRAVYPRDGDMELGFVKTQGPLPMYGARNNLQSPLGKSGNVLVVAHFEETPFGRNKGTQGIGGDRRTICLEKGRCL